MGGSNRPYQHSGAPGREVCVEEVEDILHGDHAGLIDIGRGIAAEVSGEEVEQILNAQSGEVVVIGQTARSGVVWQSVARESDTREKR